MGTTSHSKFTYLAASVSLIALLSLFLSSCFTGVEGTKKITLSREDKKAIEPTDEELFFSGVKGIPLSQWEKGKVFIAADNRALLIFDQQGLPPDPDAVSLKGKPLIFDGSESRIAPDGNLYVYVAFTNHGNRYLYNTGKTADEALNMTSDEIPMLIDNEMVCETGKLIIGQKLWIKSPLWYNDKSERIPGMKFIPVEITDVKPANIAFPVKVKFITDNRREAWVFMNFGNSGTESRSFHSLFSLTDIRKKHPDITDEAWEAICLGRVKTGMTKHECKLSLGNPNEVNSGHNYSETLDLWHYSDGTVLWFEDGILTRFRR